MTRAAWFLGILCLVAILLAPAASAAPVRLAKYDFIVGGQEAATGDFTIPAGRNRTVIITVHARTDTGPTVDYVTVDWARLDGDSAQPLTKAREAVRSVSPMHQSTTLLYRHIDNSLTGDHNVLIRMANNLTEDKVVHVHVMGNIDSTYNPVAGDGNGNQSSGAGIQAIVGQSANADFVVMDAGTHNSGPSATVSGRAPAAKVWIQVNNTTPSIKALTAYHVKTSSGSVNYSYNISASNQWSIVTVRFRAAYTIEASAGANGTITPAGDIAVLSGGSQSFDIDADTDYVIAQLLVDGTAVVAAAGLETYTYPFSAVTADHTIAATFSGRPILTVDPATEDFECTTAGYTAAIAMAGVSALDPEDGDITGSVIMSNVTFPLLATGTYTILYDVSDSDATPAVQQQRVVTAADTLDPVLTLNGEDDVILQCGIDIYTELGADAADQCDGDLTDDVVIAGDTVDTLVTDTYLITYGVSDNEGLSDSITRTVHVVDTVGPVITLLAASNPLVLDGGAYYIEAGATAWDACEGDIPPESIVIDSDDVNTGLIGTYTVTYTAEDSIGNADTETLGVIVQRETCKLIVNAVSTMVTALPNQSATLAVALDPASCAVGTVTYEWLKKNPDNSFTVIPGGPYGASYVIASASEGDSGIYRCDISDSMYTVSSPEIMLTVGTGLPVAGLAGVAIAAALAALSGAVALRKREK